MIFNSSLFLLYFLPFFLLVYYLTGKGYRNWILLFASLGFYAWGAPKYIFFVVIALIADYFIALALSKAGQPRRRWLLWFSIALNLGLLLYFKYMNFFVEQVNSMLEITGHQPVAWMQILLPVGISFITFQKLAYILDVYKNRVAPFQKLQELALYIFMFPQILSGPIVRPAEIIGQIRDRTGQDTIDHRLSGFYRFMIGLARKVIIADTLGITVNEIFSLQPVELSSGLAWIGAIAYTFQIYFDFSGYSDMAIGLARMLGFRLPENFNFPYISQSITEFWRRWHMTLSFWFRDFLFLPLAYRISAGMPREKYLGLRADKVIYLMATSVTFLLCGFWHGAAWTFILWGAYMGLFLVMDRLFLLRWLKKAGRIPSTVLTFLIVMFGWVLFRSATPNDALIYIGKMFSIGSADNQIWLNAKFWTMLAIAATFSFSGVIKHAETWVNRLYLDPPNGQVIGFSVIAVVLFILGVATITSSGFSPFIYFRF